MLVEKLFVFFLLVVTSQQAKVCTPVSSHELLKKLGKGYIDQYMSTDENFNGNHPLQYNKHGICRSKVEIHKLSEKYFPRFIRNVECDSEGDTCLTVKSCQTVEAYIKILEKEERPFCDDDGKEPWTTFSFKIGAGCECAVETI